MERDLLEALHRGREAGGKGLDPKQLTTLKGKDATAFVQRLLDAKWLVKAGKKYDLTPASEEAYLAAPAEVLEDFRSAPLLDFLSLVQTKKGKPSAADLKKVPPEAITEAKSRGYLRDGEKAGTFVILPPGEIRLLGRLDLAEQIERLRPLLEQTEARVQALLQRLAGDLPGEGGLASRLTRVANDALTALTKAVTTAEAVPEVAALGKQAQTTAEAALAEARSLHETIEREKAELLAFEKLLRGHFERLEKLAPTRPTPEPRKPAPEPVKPTDDQLWQVTREAHAVLVKESNVKIPELFDRVHGRQPSLTLAEFHQALLRWKDADRLTLQVCGHRDAEKRASEGIEGPKGLYFYVQLH